MNASSDVIVLGGGIIGLSCALRLRQAGLTVVVLESGVCGREASWAAAGIIAPGNPHRTDHLYAMHCASIQRYPDFCAEVRALSGVDPQYERCGAVELLTTEQFVQMAASDVRVTADRTTDDGLPILELLTPEQGRALEPAVTGDALGVLHCRVTAQIRNPRMMAALCGACDKVGVEIREHQAVTSLVMEGERVTGVRTADAVRSADRVILCAGAWSSRCGPPGLGERIPVHPVRGQIVLLFAPDRPFQHVVQRRHTYLVPRNDGYVLLGATVEPDAGFDKRCTANGIHGLIADALTLAPSLAEASVAATWAGFRPGTPDARPFIGPVPDHDGLIAATGHYRSGLALAPVTADVVRDLVVDGTNEFDLARCAPGRHFPGP